MSASPNSHALLNVSWGHLVTQVNHKLGKLFDVDNVFGVLGVCIDDLCASVWVMHRNKNIKGFQNGYTVVSNMETKASLHVLWGGINLILLFWQRTDNTRLKRRKLNLTPSFSSFKKNGNIYNLTILIISQFALPCYLQWLFALQSLFVSSQIPECWWSQACVWLLNACQSQNTHTHNPASSQNIRSQKFTEKIWIMHNIRFSIVQHTHLSARWSSWAAAGCHPPLVWSVWSKCFDPEDEEQWIQ